MPEQESKLKVGDVVNYIPHVCHAFSHNALNEYAWAIGEKQPPRMVRNPDTGEEEIVEEIKEVEEGFLQRVKLPALNRCPNPREERKKLVPLYPKKTWKATVAAILPDGTLALNVESEGPATLHYKNVPVDETRQLPHSCHKGGV